MADWSSFHTSWKTHRVQATKHESEGILRPEADLVVKPCSHVKSASNLQDGFCGNKWLCSHLTLHFQEEDGRDCYIQKGSFLTKNSLKTRKSPAGNRTRHTDRGVSSTPSAVLSPGEEGGVPNPDLARWGGVPRDGVPPVQDLGPGYPQEGTWDQPLGYPPERTWDQYYEMEILWDGDRVNTPPPTCEQTDICENIASRCTTYAVGNSRQVVIPGIYIFITTQSQEIYILGHHGSWLVSSYDSGLLW